VERELSSAASPRVSVNGQLTHCAVDDAAETPAQANSMSGEKRPEAKGRGAYVNPPNRFGQVHAEDDLEHVEHDEEYLAGLRILKTQYLPDESRSIVSKNDSPDLNFNYSLNPYRGCLHGCSYCYARPTHEYLGLNAGLDFESKIFVKERAPELFRDFLARDNWTPELIAFSGITDCYQPIERDFQLTRQCLEVAVEARQPIGMVTKNALVTRDLDVLIEMASHRVITVAISVTTLDAELARVMEPRTSTPEARLRAISKLADANVPVSVMIGPVIPGLNDSEIPAILKAAAEAGAKRASWNLLRLPLAVRPIFEDWLARVRPLDRERVESRIQACRDGGMNDANFGSRMRGSGEFAEQISQTFRVFSAKHGLDRGIDRLDTTGFRPPKPSSGQLRLF
jgi:DNA repair photolyase